MYTALKQGIPHFDDYQSVLSSDLFLHLESYSRKFLEVNQAELSEYSEKWVSDPLHQWSRQYEYPFVYAAISSFFDEDQSFRVLDAGSGATFFPYCLKENFRNSQVFCCDYDEMVGGVYDAINHKAETDVGFSKADLRHLPYADNEFDALYCISVLEHTDAYARIIDEIRRVTKPGGKIIVTFDISIDGTRDIDPDRAQHLMDLLLERFQPIGEANTDIKAGLQNTGIFSTLNADPELLPWKKRSVTSRLKQRLKGLDWPPPCTFYCITLVNPGDPEQM